MSITYPVDPDSRWATWRISTAEIVKHNKPWPRADGMPVEDQSPDIIPLLEVREDQPAYDPLTHRLEQATPIVDLDENTHTHGWNIVPLSQEDLDAIAEREAAIAEYPDMFNGVGTAGERIERLEKMTSYLFRVLLDIGNV